MWLRRFPSSPVSAITRRALALGLLLAGCTPRTSSTPSPYLALGDSYTVGEGVRARETYPYRLARRRGWPAPVVVAKTGWTSHDLLVAARRLDGTFTLVTLQIGANDVFRRRSQQRYEQDLSALLDLAFARAGGDPKRVVVVSIPDFSVMPAARGRTDLAAIVRRFNGAAKALVERRGAHWVSVVASSRRMADEPELRAADDLHPSGAIYGLWAELIDPTL